MRRGSNCIEECIGKWHPSCTRVSRKSQTNGDDPRYPVYPGRKWVASAWYSVLKVLNKCAYCRLHLRASWRRPKHCCVLSGTSWKRWWKSFRITPEHHVVSSGPLGSWSHFSSMVFTIPTWISKVRRVSGRLFFQDEAEEVGMQKSGKDCAVTMVPWEGSPSNPTESIRVTGMQAYDMQVLADGHLFG